MKEKAINDKVKKIALISIFLLFLVGTASATCDLYIDSVAPDFKYPNEIYANETNPVAIVVCNNGNETAYDITVNLYASDLGFIDSTTITSIGPSACAEPVVIVDTEIRSPEDGPVTYTANVSCSSPLESDYDNNEKTSTSNNVVYNGYKGKRFWSGASDIETKHTYSGNINMVYYNQTPASYASTSWTTRSEVWTTTNLPVPGDVVAAWLYISYNWDNSGGTPDFTAKFNDEDLNLGTPYTDKSNIGTYGSKLYGLFAVNVTDYYNKNIDNYLNMTRGDDNQALYPSTLVVIYSSGSTNREIIINEECDELAVADTTTHKYGTTEDEATAYAAFSINDINNVNSVKLYSFAASAGNPVAGTTSEGNLFFNNYEIANAWQGNSKSTCPYFWDVTAYKSSASEAKIQGTSDTGMLALQQILVVAYDSEE